MKNLIISPKTEGKGRSFRATLMASVEADLLWSGGQTESDNKRPVWSMFTGSENELKAFMANLTTGRQASFPNNTYSRSKEVKLEILKSAGYRTVWQKEEEGAIATVFLPDLFMIDPGLVDPKGVKFILLPTKKWISDQNKKIDIDHLKEYITGKCGYTIEDSLWASIVPMSFLFAAYLDRRTRCPLIADEKFFLQLMLSCLNHGLASFSSSSDRYGYRHYAGEKKEFGVHRHLRYHEDGLDQVGLLPGVIFNSSHEILEKLLAEEVTNYFSYMAPLFGKN